MQDINSIVSFFTIYQSNKAIELHPGCDDYPGMRIISTSRSYESAFQVAQAAADARQIPFKNYVPAEILEGA